MFKTIVPTCSLFSLCFACLGSFFSGSTLCNASDELTVVPIFSRTQLKYGLGRTDYANRWVDRPLFTNPAFSDPENPHPGNLVNASFRKIQETAVQYGLHGLAFFPENYHGAARAYGLVTENKIPNFELLTDFGPQEDLEKKVFFAGEALANPASFRIDGKVVIVSYLADNRPPEFWETVMREIRAKHGDHFIFLPSLVRFAGESTTQWGIRFDQGNITPAQEAAIKEDLRKWVRATDGLYFESIANLKTKERTLHDAFYRDFIIRHMKEVLAEPEFAGKKYFGLSACIGHENSTRFGYTLSSDGTATLRKSLEAALEARPDLIVIPEWDEQNENTSLRPTVYNGRTAMRLLRHYTSQEQGKLQEPLPGDDTQVPNLILSYRKILVLGESLKLELLHVPETGVLENTDLEVELELMNEAGQIVYASRKLEIPSGKLWEHNEIIPSEQFAQYRYLLPVIRVKGPAGEQVFTEGFQAIDLRPSWNWDYKWVMQPVRDLLIPDESEFMVTTLDPAKTSKASLLEKIKGVFGFPSEKSPNDEKNLYEVSANFKSSEPLAYVEILDNDDVIYSHELADSMPRETADTAVFRIDWQSLEWLANARLLEGRITLKNAEGDWIVPEEMTVDGRSILFNGLASSIWVNRAILSIPKNQLDAGILEIDLPGIWQGEIPLRTIYDSGIYGLPGPVGFNLVISRFLKQDRTPHHLKTNNISFTVPVIPDLPRSRLHLQAISASGKVYRSRPFITGTPSSDQKILSVFSDHTKQAQEVTVDTSVAPDIAYDFTPDETGSVLKTSAGRPFWGILGGYSTQATGRGGGESRDGTPFLKPGDYPALITNALPEDYARDKIGAHTSISTQSAPDWVAVSPTVNALAFNGESTFVTLPQGVIPRRAGYEIHMELMPDHVEGKQLLISNQSYYLGSLAVFLENGILKARFLNGAVIESTVDSGLKIEPAKWSLLKVRYDQKTLTFQVNDEISQSISVPGPGLYDTVSVVGGYGKEWFAGKIKSLRIQHGQADNGLNLTAAPPASGY